MGQGRLPVPDRELQIHIVALGKAVEAGVQRDFAGHTAIQGTPITAALVEELARQHARLLHANHIEMNDKLAVANQAGEEGRKQEMKRIFGARPHTLPPTPWLHALSH
jgi:hypothetical protein